MLNDRRRTDYDLQLRTSETGAYLLIGAMLGSGIGTFMGLVTFIIFETVWR